MRIALIGAGNVATNLSQALVQVGHSIVQVYSRTDESASLLAKKLNCTYTSNVANIIVGADVYLFSVKDSILASLAKKIAQGRSESLFIHTAGSMPLSVFENLTPRYGVVYPMQTFSKERKVDFKHIPIFIEANSHVEEQKLILLFGALSDNVSVLSSTKRKFLHLAAVFACNFTNHCYAKAEQLLKEEGIPFDVMLPLIEETAAKIHSLSPQAAQTGPAVRFDKNVMDAHCSLLSKEDAELYMQMSKSIHQL
ncbi:MAG: DUF2520 domain-containing protein [Bacteroidaceae bacterium]